jgi:hypothetical protein
MMLHGIPGAGIPQGIPDFSDREFQENAYILKIIHG